VRGAPVSSLAIVQPTYRSKVQSLLYELAWFRSARNEVDNVRGLGWPRRADWRAGPLAGGV